MSHACQVQKGKPDPSRVLKDYYDQRIVTLKSQGLSGDQILFELKKPLPTDLVVPSGLDVAHIESFRVILAINSGELQISSDLFSEIKKSLSSSGDIFSKHKPLPESALKLIAQAEEKNRSNSQVFPSTLATNTNNPLLAEFVSANMSTLTEFISINVFSGQDRLDLGSALHLKSVLDINSVEKSPESVWENKSETSVREPQVLKSNLQDAPLTMVHTIIDIELLEFTEPRIQISVETTNQVPITLVTPIVVSHLNNSESQTAAPEPMILQPHHSDLIPFNPIESSEAFAYDLQSNQPANDVVIPTVLALSASIDSTAPIFCDVKPSLVFPVVMPQIRTPRPARPLKKSKILHLKSPVILKQKSHVPIINNSKSAKKKQLETRFPTKINRFILSKIEQKKKNKKIESQKRNFVPVLKEKVSSTKKLKSPKSLPTVQNNLKKTINSHLIVTFILGLFSQKSKQKNQKSTPKSNYKSSMN